MSERASEGGVTNGAPSRRHGRFALPRRTRMGRGWHGGAQPWIEADYIPSGTADLWRSARSGARR